MDKEKEERDKEKHPHRKWRDEASPYVPPKLKGKVRMQVFLDPDMRLGVRALARTEGTGMSARDYVEKVLSEEISSNPNKVVQGKELLNRSDLKQPYHSKLRMLEEEKTRLIEELRKKDEGSTPGNTSQSR